MLVPVVSVQGDVPPLPPWGMVPPVPPAGSVPPPPPLPFPPFSPVAEPAGPLDAEHPPRKSPPNPPIANARSRVAWFMTGLMTKPSKLITRRRSERIYPRERCLARTEVGPGPYGTAASPTAPHAFSLHAAPISG